MAVFIFDDINIEPLLKAEIALKDAIQVAQSDLEKTGAIKIFEYSYELSWKMMKRILKKKGLETASPRNVFRIAAEDKLIKSSEIWFDFIVKRNLTSHTYSLKTAEEIFNFLPEFHMEMLAFIENIKE